MAWPKDTTEVKRVLREMLRRVSNTSIRSVMRRQLDQHMSSVTPTEYTSEECIASKLMRAVNTPRHIDFQCVVS